MSEDTPKQQDEQPAGDPTVEDLAPGAEEQAVSGGAADVFLNIGGIKGESQDSDHKDWIE